MIIHECSSGACAKYSRPNHRLYFVFENLQRGKMMIWFTFTRKHGLWLWILTFLLYYAAAQQEGYISVDCGASANSTDPDTMIDWTTDAPYISTGVNQILTTVPSSSLNERQLKTLRYFPANRSRHCYSLPASKNSAYLVRATFLHGGFQTEVDNEFDLSIDSTVVDTVAWTPDYVDALWTHEYVVAATSNLVNFCLIPKVGVAFMSTLELRPLAEGMYHVVFDGRYLKSLARLNCGAQPTDPPIRYPDDLYDRIWDSPGENFTYNTTTTTSESDVEVLPASVSDRPPLAVMQSAWVSEVTESFGWALAFGEYELNKTTTFYTNHFFAEIENIGPTDTRLVDMDVNGGEALHNISFQKFETTQIYNAERSITLPWANYTFSASAGSVLGPLLNAAEFYASRAAIQATTDDRDVSALEVVKTSLGLSSWTGDPCLPVSYDWLTCGEEANPRVKKINLTEYNLVGTIPAGIAELAALKELLLDNNKIGGAIPDLSKLTELTTLHLQNNFLTGGIPNSVAFLPVLTELFLSNNSLSGPVPAALADRSGLKLEISGNVKLCAPTEDCPILQADLPDGNNHGGGGGGGGLSAAVVGVIVGGVLVLAILVAVWLYCTKRPKPIPAPAFIPVDNYKRDQTGVSQGLNASPNGSVGGAAAVNQARAFALAEVQRATQGFDSKIGKGGFGPVYYGKLTDGTELAVKVKSTTSSQGTTEFFNEVSLLSRVHHKNLVAMLGYCEENGQQILIYEYMAKGTLSDHLYGKDMKGRISWKQRLEIALNAAKGLEYLHNDCIPKIIHRDIKSNNILLNEKLLAKVADFGIWKLAPDEDQSGGVSTKIIGTPGYLDPEYHKLNKLTQKSDVYSFGVVLLEIICGRSPYSPTTGEYNLVEWARGCLRINDLEALVDPAMVDRYNIVAMWKVAELAVSCVEPYGGNRPDMKQVVRGLIEASEFEEARTQDYGPPAAGGVGAYSGTSFRSESSYPLKKGSATSIPEYPGPEPYPSAPLLLDDLFTPTTTTTTTAFEQLPSDTRDSSRLAPR